VTEQKPTSSTQTTPDPTPIFLQSGIEWVATEKQAEDLVGQGLDPEKIIIDPDLAFGNAFIHDVIINAAYCA